MHKHILSIVNNKKYLAITLTHQIKIFFYENEIKI